MFEWSEKYRIGVKAIDEQHQRFFEIGNEINTLIVDFAGENIEEQLYDLFVKLVDYTTYHFIEEEEYMNSIGYQSEHHKQAHRAFIDRLHSINLHDIDKEQGQFAFKLLKLISSWLIDHIMYEDMKMKNV